MRRFALITWIFGVIMFVQPVIALSAEKVGVATFNYTSIGEYDLNQAIIRSKALDLACKNAFKKYVSTFNKAKKQNYKRVKKEIESDLSAYMDCTNVVDEEHIKSTQSFKIAVKAEINADEVEMAINDASASAGEDNPERPVVILMFVRKVQGSFKKDDRVTKVNKTTNDSVTNKSSDNRREEDASYNKDINKSVDSDQLEAVDEDSVVSSSNTGTNESGAYQGNSSSNSDDTNRTNTVDTKTSTTGGSRISSSEKLTYIIDGSLGDSVESGVLEPLEDNNFSLSDITDYDDALITLYEDLQEEYNDTSRMPKKIIKKLKLGFAKEIKEDSDSAQCYMIGSFDVGQREIDPATGKIVKLVNVSQAKIECMKPRKEGKKIKWKGLARVSGISAKGLGTTETEAEQNAIRECARKVGTKLMDKINAKN